MIGFVLPSRVEIKVVDTFLLLFGFILNKEIYMSSVRVIFNSNTKDYQLNFYQKLIINKISKYSL